MKIIRINDFSIVTNDLGESVLACDRFLQIECVAGAQPLAGTLSIEDDMEVAVDVPVERMPAQARTRNPEGIRYVFKSNKDIVKPDKKRLLLFWRSSNYDYTAPIDLSFGFRD